MKQIFRNSIFILSMLFSTALVAQIDRQYEPVIIPGDSLLADSPSLFSAPEIAHLYLYVFHASPQSWQLIPFQIDEVNPNVDDSLKYFAPEDEFAGIFDGDDELVFITGNLGDKANDNQWVDGADSARLEIEIHDSLDNQTGYAYLYYFQNQTFGIPNTYEMDYNEVNDRVMSANYEAGYIERAGADTNTTGMLNDVVIKQGINADIFDRQKVRAIGSLWIIPVYLDENMLVASRAYAKVGPVRVIRNMAGKFVYSGLELDEGFTQTSFFYPWHGVFELPDIPLDKATESGAQVDEIRISWDFNEAASGMTFYSESNPAGTSINGIADGTINTTCTPGELNWTMGTGDQGTLLNIFNIPALGDNIGIYYFESLTGKVGESSPLSKDTGDMKSFGDNGFFLSGGIENYFMPDTKFKVQFFNFFLPPNFEPAAASRLSEQMKTPLTYHAIKQINPTTAVAANTQTPLQFTLMQNYPNPFNSSTTFSFLLNHESRVTLQVYDVLGTVITTLVDNKLSAGQHQYIWNSTDDSGMPVASGLYLYTLKTETQQQTQKLLLIK
ncbi:T9SS type A sorting domain-containing protein [candidate division KSB1 bacterium]|nr:T9SS type A sorting domain-containing protein [candidate division KSB1 bacterium]